MKKILALTILSLLLIRIVYSQKPECGTILYDFQREYLNNRGEQLKNFSFSPRGVTSVPVQFHILRLSDGSGGFPDSLVYKELDTVNYFYANAGIEFFICDSIHYIDDDFFYNNYFDWTLEDSLCIPNDVSDVINIYITANLSYCGYAYFPPSADRVFVNDDCASNGSTMAHELGHYFSLYHTHETMFGDELVNGTNCSAAGDLLCDTPADPELSGLVDASCVYTGTATDANGDPYNPMVENILSYSRKTCRDTLTPQQYAQANFSFINDRNYLTCGITGLSERNTDEIAWRIFPNPSLGKTNILYSLASGSYVRLEIYNSIGEKIQTLVSKTQNPGEYRYQFSIPSHTFPSQFYLVRLSVDDKSYYLKLIVLY